MPLASFFRKIESQSSSGVDVKVRTVIQKTVNNTRLCVESRTLTYNG